MSYDVYRPSNSYDERRPRYVDKRPDRPGDRYHTDRTARRYDEDQQHPYEWYRSRSQSRSPRRRRSPSPHGRDRSPPRRNGDMYRFGAGDDRVNGASNHNGRDDFTFRSNEQREFRDAPPPPRDAPRGPRTERDGNRGGRGRFRGRGRYRDNFQRRKFQHPADRDILHANKDREGTPERLEGMIEGQSRFKDVNELFVSEDEEDEESAMDLEGSDDDAEPSKKRAKTDDEVKPVEEEKPKWSNPDPYYLVPPLDESRKNRMDVVQLLRKAKVEAQENTTKANAVSRNVDFIGFGDGEDEDEDDEETDETGAGQGRSSAPAALSEEGEIDEDDDMSGNHDQDGANPASLPNDNVHNTDKAASTTSNTLDSSSFSHLRNLHNMSAYTANGASTAVPKTAPSQNIIVIDDDDADETPIDDARKLLAEINAADHPPPQASKKNLPKGQKRKHSSEGEITKTWVAKNRATSAPWYIDHSATPETVFWLHKEICDFYEFIKPKDYEIAIRQDLVRRVQSACARASPGAKLCSFGSFAQGIFLPTSDMDLVLYTPSYQQGRQQGFALKSLLYRIRDQLFMARMINAKQDAIVIIGAKVPIVKFTDVVTGIHCDISVDNDSGVKALTTFERWQRTWPFLPKLLCVLKQWLLMRGINEVFNGGLGGFSLTCMLVSMLQQRVDGQTQNLGPNAYLGELLLEFFDLYGNKFNMDVVGIDMPLAEYFDKTREAAYKDDRWTIIDPNNPSNDLSGGSSQARLIQKKFSESHSALLDLMKRLESAPFVIRRRQSFLRLIIGGNYERVILQRRILRGLLANQPGRAQNGR